MLTDEQAERLRADLAMLGAWEADDSGLPTVGAIGPWNRLGLDRIDRARLLLAYHDALAPERLAHAISEALDEQAERGGGLNVHDLAAKVRAKIMEAEHDQG